jgi:fatty acid desaturase
MLRYLSRQMQRSRDLASGVDADLVASNRRRFRVGWISFLIFLAFLGLMHALDHFAHPHWLEVALFIPCAAAFLVALFALKIASAEKAFLDKPDPEEPPRLDR